MGQFGIYKLFGKLFGNIRIKQLNFSITIDTIDNQLLGFF